LLSVVLIHGISQQYFEMIHTPEIYTQHIVQHSSTLNVILMLDNIFIILYTSMAFFAVKTWSDNAPDFVSIMVNGLISAVALLDFLENFHIYALMQQAKSGIAVTAADISWQAAESMMKWHLAYFAFFLLGFLVPNNRPVEKMLKYALWCWFVPTGVLLYGVTDTIYEVLFQWLRFLNLLSGFVLIFLILRRQST
jgi:hypothetical protein